MSAVYSSTAGWLILKPIRFTLESTHIWSPLGLRQRNPWIPFVYDGINFDLNVSCRLIYLPSENVLFMHYVELVWIGNKLKYLCIFCVYFLVVFDSGRLEYPCFMTNLKAAFVDCFHITIGLWLPIKTFELKKCMNK